ncbi:hypothetical protein [Methanosphaerula palustris]|nr:hypothetical protein [Methanosphaerula palustris]
MSARAEYPALLQRWRRMQRALKAEDQPAMDRLIQMLETHAQVTFQAFDDPLEAAFVAVLICLIKQGEKNAA